MYFFIVVIGQIYLLTMPPTTLPPLALLFFLLLPLDRLPISAESLSDDPWPIATMSIELTPEMNGTLVN